MSVHSTPAGTYEGEMASAQPAPAGKVDPEAEDVREAQGGARL